MNSCCADAPADRRIHPGELAYDIDGVVADTMEIFVQLARDRYGMTELSKDDLTQYDLHQCVPLDRSEVDELICLTLDDEHTSQVPPMPGAPELLTELAGHGPLRFVTARIWPESIIHWLHATLPRVAGDDIQVIATGDPAAKLAVLHDLGVRYFLEDRLETCELLAQDGIQPLLFDQPWNQGAAGFPRIHDWYEFRHWVLV
jgi:uncharacterized HAD superfamily protein